MAYRVKLTVMGVSRNGSVTGYFVRSGLKDQRRSFATIDLPEAKVRVIAATEMDSRHNHLDAVLDPEQT